MLEIKNVSKVWDFLQGNVRNAIYNSKFKFMMQDHIQEQIKFRLRVMNPECLKSGSCIECGCTTPALQMANKSCDGFCYPPMLSKRVWKSFKSGHMITRDDMLWRVKKQGCFFSLHRDGKKLATFRW